MSFTETGCKKEEHRIALGNCSHVGYGGFISACEGTIVCLDVKERQDFRNGEGGVFIEVASGRAGPINTIIARIVLRANGLSERENGVQGLINIADRLDGCGSQLVGACTVEIRDLRANERFGTRVCD